MLMMVCVRRQAVCASATLTAGWTPHRKINNRHKVNNIPVTTGGRVSHFCIFSHRMAETSGRFQISDFQTLWCSSTSWDLISRRVTAQSNPNRADSLRPCQALSWLIINRTPYPAATGGKWDSWKKKKKETDKQTLSRMQRRPLPLLCARGHSISHELPHKVWQSGTEMPNSVSCAFLSIIVHSIKTFCSDRSRYILIRLENQRDSWWESSGRATAGIIDTFQSHFSF